MTALTRSDELYIAECLLSRARHQSRKLTHAERRGRPLHPELERKMREDLTESTPLALLLQAQKPDVHSPISRTDPLD